MSAKNSAPETPKRASLFRSEALASGRVGADILLVGPASHSVLVTLFTAIAISIICFLAVFSYTRKTPVSGVLLPMEGLVRVTAIQGGLVTARSVQEGQQVRAGDLLLTLSNERSGSTGASTEATVSSTLKARRESIEHERNQQRMQYEERLSAARRRATDLRAESDRIDGQLSIQRQRVALAEASVARFAELRASGFVSPVQTQEKQVELLDQRQRAVELERAKASVRRDEASVAAEIRDVEFQAQRDMEAMKRSISSIEQELAENEARRDVAVRASRDGTVTAVLVEVGQAVGQGQVIASIIPANARLEAELYAPSRAAGFIKPGMKVLLRYAPYAFQKFGQAHGTVHDVSAAPFRTSELASTPVQPGGAELVYRIRVSLDKQTITAYGQERSLRPGTTVEASIVLESRKLYEWLLDPLYSVKGRL